MKGIRFQGVALILSLALGLVFVSCTSTAASGTDNASVVVGNSETINLATVEPSVSTGAKYSEAPKKLDIQNIEYFKFKLSRSLKSGESLNVHVTGENLGKVGFRSWLVDAKITTLSDIMKTAEMPGFGSGDFDLQYKLTSTGNIKYLFFKGPVYGTNIDHITIKSVTVTY